MSSMLNYLTTLSGPAALVILTAWSPAFAQRALVTMADELEREPEVVIYDFFGASTAVNSEFLFVGAPNKHQVRSGYDGGIVEVFRRAPGGWMPHQRLEPAGSSHGARYGTHIAWTEEFVAVTSSHSDELGLNTGSIHVYRRFGDDWVIDQVLLPPCNTRSGFGNRVGLSGTTIVTTGYVDTCFTPSIPEDGAAHVFERTAAGWTLTHILQVAGILFFGCTIQTDGHQIVVSQLQANSARPTVVFRRSGNDWVESQRIQVPAGAHSFGNQMAIRGDLLAICAYGYGGGPGASRGRVYLYRDIAGQWTLEQVLTASDVNPLPLSGSDHFGVSVALGDELVLVGAELAAALSGVAVPQNGAAYLFERRQGLWTEIARYDHPLAPEPAAFGAAVALTEGEIIVGARTQAVPGIGVSGSVWVHWRDLGAVVCAGRGNSTGSPASLHLNGSLEASRALFELRATDLPPGATAFALASRTTSHVPHPGGSQGDLCLGGSIARLLATTRAATPGGTYLAPVDLTQIPTQPLPSAVLAGETWAFQLWYRDANPQLTSNFSSASAATFR
jgi:hypothetical protein